MTDKKWHEIALTPAKGEKMPMTEAHFDKVIAMRDELIFEQKDEISRLKMKVNKLEQQSKRGVKKRSFSLIYGIGINDSDYVTVGKGVYCEIYNRWRKMIDRCYSKKQITYAECYVCSDWLYFSNFKRWMVKQEWEGKDLDKDILIKGNKVYSPETCIFVTRKINTLISFRKSKKSGLPPGVFKSPNGKRFVSRCSNENGKNIRLGTFDSATDAGKAYKKYKSSVIVIVANMQTEPLRSALLLHA